MVRLASFNILKELVLTDFKLKYWSPVFGYLWSVINPLIMLTTLYIVFSFIIQISTPHYQLFLLIGIIIWNFFQDTTDLTLNSLNEKSDLIKKLNISPINYLISSEISSFLNLSINLVIFFIMMFIFGLKIHLSSLLYGAFYLILLVFCSFGVSLILAGIYVRLRDIKHIWNIIILVWFWLTPIFYAETRIPENIRKYYMLNPIARIINHVRDVFVFDFHSSSEQVLITMILCITILLFGFLIFSYSNPKFAEEL